MAMLDIADLEDRVRKEITGADVTVDTDGYYYNFTVVSDVFDGLNAVKRQQLVYGALNDLISSGELHAVNIKTQTTEEAR